MGFVLILVKSFRIEKDIHQVYSKGKNIFIYFELSGVPYFTDFSKNARGVVLCGPFYPGLQ